MMSVGTSKRSLPRAKNIDEVLRELMGEKRFDQWFGDSPWWLESSPGESKIASKRSRVASTK